VCYRYFLRLEKEIKKMTEIEQVFEVLFFGSGSWLGLLLFLTIFLGLMLKWKYASCILIPIAIFIGLEYLTNNLGWHAIIMFMTTIFMLSYLAKEAKS